MANSDRALLRTPLFALHESLGGRMVPFAGYAMPVQYTQGIIKEHTHTRAAAGLFDVSHMGQLRFSGDDAAAALETTMPIDVIGLPDGRQRYGFLTDANGGIIDDLMVARLGAELLVVVNAARKRDDLEVLRAATAGVAELEVLERALLALQGPAAADVLARLAPAARSMAFMDVALLEVAGVECYVSRSGYTGEDGYEISVPAGAAEALARTLLSHAEVAPIGLGARDSLRLEAGLCLYGNDIDTSTTPVEAKLTWALSKTRRSGGARAGGYPGAAVIAAQLDDGVARMRVGLLPQSRVPVRGGTALLDASGQEVGVVTSGGFGPTLQAPVAMGYAHAAAGAVGTRLNAMVRDKPVEIVVAKMPVVEHNYVR